MGRSGPATQWPSLRAAHLQSVVRYTVEELDTLIVHALSFKKNVLAVIFTSGGVCVLVQCLTVQG